MSENQARRAWNEGIRKTPQGLSSKALRGSDFTRALRLKRG